MTIYEHKLQNDYIGDFNPKDLLSNIIAYYPMQGNLNDDSGNGYNLSVIGGSYTGGTRYNTVTNLESRNTSISYTTTSSYTISCWLNTTSSFSGMIAKIGYSGNWFLQVRKTLSYCVIGTASQSNTTAISPEPTGWHMFSCSFDYSTHKLSFFLDGVLKASVTSSSGSLRSDTGLALGGGNGFTGGLGISFIVNNASTDLLAFYNATKANYGL